MDRFQGHFGKISRKDKDTLITDHFSSSNHRGIEDIEIYVLDYIHLSSKKSKELRFKIEAAGITNLGSSFPDALIYLD